MKPTITEFIEANLGDTLFYELIKKSSITEEVLQNYEKDDILAFAESIKEYLHARMSALPLEIVEGLAGILGTIQREFGTKSVQPDQLDVYYKPDTES